MAGEQPFVTIVTPTRDRPAALAGCLAALALLRYPRERFEVVVVDDGGGLPLAATLEPFAARIDVKLLCQPHAGPAVARNAGAAAARGDWIAFTDDDCRPEPDWLAALVARCEAGLAVGGRTATRCSRIVMRPPGN